MYVLISALLGIAVTIVVLYPFIKAKLGDNLHPDASTEMQSAVNKNRLIRNEIDALKLEKELGTIDVDEYRLRLDFYRIKGAQTLRDIDQALEEEIRSAKEKL